MAMNAFLDLTGLQHYDGKLKSIVGGSLSIDGRTITLKSVSGSVLGTATVPQTTYNKATASADGLMSKEDFVKLEGISEGATKVEVSATNGKLKIDGVEVNVYTPETLTAYGSGLYKITVNEQGKITAATPVTKADITALGVPGQDTTYEAATADHDGLMTSAHFTKVEGIENGAQVNILEKVSVNGSALTVNSKGVNIDLTGYALKTDIASGVNYRGSVDTYAELPKSPANGDMYNVVEADAANGIDAGTNVVWNGTTWDAMAPMITFSGISNTEIDALFA